MIAAARDFRIVFVMAANEDEAGKIAGIGRGKASRLCQHCRPRPFDLSMARDDRERQRI
jgi:MarR-like DNA-binding transcriptional regulator SgrR of sgrS sRNA